MPENILEAMREVGSIGHLNDNQRILFANYDWINRRGRSKWEPLAWELNQTDLELLIRGLVIIARELEWLGGSAASAIWLFLIFEERFSLHSNVLADWVLRNRGRNQYLPYGGRTDAASHTEWIAEQRAKELGQVTHEENQRRQQQEKEQQREMREEFHEKRCSEGLDRAKMVQKYNSSLASMSTSDRIKAIIASEMPLEAVNHLLLQDILHNVLSVDKDTKLELLTKIDNRKRGLWGKIKRKLLRPTRLLSIFGKIIVCLIMTVVCFWYLFSF